MLIIMHAMERLRYFNSWSPEEALAFHALTPRQQERYHSRINRWVRMKIGGPMPLIPGTQRDARPDTDASSTEHSEVAAS